MNKTPLTGNTRFHSLQILQSPGSTGFYASPFSSAPPAEFQNNNDPARAMLPQPALTRSLTQNKARPDKPSYQTNSGPVVYQDFAKGTFGLHPHETEKLKNIFDDYDIVDLQQSELTSLRSWMDALTQRLTTSIESLGEYYPEYRVSLLDSDETNAFIYKYRPTGQKYYRGHVFISLGLLRKMIATILKKHAVSEVSAEDILQLSDAQIDTLLNGLQGIAAHEFSHPKEDELIKWEWREAKDKSWQSHGQGDEAATDLIALKVLKEAKLAASNMLLGLELLFGYEPSTRPWWLQSAIALTSSHPENKLRLNIVRGGLIKQRLDEGKAEIKPLPFQAAGIRHDLARLVRNSEPESKVETILRAAREKNVSPVLLFASESLTRLQKGFENIDKRGNENFTAFLNEMEIWKLLLDAVPPLNAAEEQAMASWFDKIFPLGKHCFETDFLWSTNGSGNSDANAYHYSFQLVRNAQKIYENHPLFRTTAWQKWLKDKRENSFWKLCSSTNYLAVILPREHAFSLYQEILDRHHKLDAPLRAQKLLEVIEGLVLAGRATESLHLETLHHLHELFRSDEEIGDDIARNIHNVLYSQSRKGSRLYWMDILTSSQIRTAWSSFLWDIFAQKPHLFMERFSLGAALSYRYESSREKWWWEILQWNLCPSYFRRPFSKNHKQDTTALTSQVTTLLRNEAWQNFLKEAFVALGGNKENPHQKYLLNESDGLTHLIACNTLSFSPKQRLQILETTLLSTIDASADSPIFKGSVRFEAAVLKGIDIDQKNFFLERARAFVKRIYQAGETDILAYLEEIFHGPEGLVENLFKNGDALVFALNDWHQQGLLNETEWHQALERYLYSIRPTGNLIKQSPLESLNKNGAYLLWNKARQSGPEGVVQFLSRIAKAHQTSPEEGVIETTDKEIRHLLLAGIQTMPDYARVADFIHEGLGDDFRKLLGLTRHDNSTAFTKALQEHYDIAKSFLTIVFNPDEQTIPLTLRGIANFHHLDGPAKTVFGAIPSGSLNGEQARELWNIATAKRANRHTDIFFEKDVLPYLKNLPHKEKLAAYHEFLENGRLRSERLKNMLMEPLLEETLQGFSSHADGLADHDIRPIFDHLGALIPDGSRFRDDLLEKIAWELELSEAQTLKFIEPMKSFSFRSMNPLTVNLLSGLSRALGKLKKQEKLALVRHFSAPSGSIRDAVPRFSKIAKGINEYLRASLNIKNFDLLDRLDGFVRDAGENDRLVLIELLVGTPEEGLWFADEETREELYNLASLEQGSLKRKLFDAYLKALPAYEHSTTLSYLIATLSEGSSESELLHILETFDAPGIKFAQMASVLGIFGPERSEELAAAKDRAQPPSRALVYQTLKKALPPEEFAKIKHVRRLLGSGSIKFVVLLEYHDGTVHAASLRRPFLDERIASTLDIAFLWSQELLKDKEFSQEYDFDHYLKSLKQQLAQEVNFNRELDLAKSMMEEYKKLPAHQGWTFQPVLPSEDKTQNSHILHFTAIENAVPFEKLSKKDQIAAAQLIVDAELHLLLNKGHFDADRHLGNYLFDPQTKSVYPIDMGQTYSLTPNTLFTPGDRYAIAEWLYGITNEDPAVGAETLTRVFLRIAKNRGENISALPPLVEGIETALRQEGDFKLKTIRVLSELNKRRIRLPLRFTMGIVKGLTIVLNEKYAKVLSDDFATTRIRSFVKKQLFWGSRFQVWDTVKSMVS